MTLTALRDKILAAVKSVQGSELLDLNSLDEFRTLLHLSAPNFLVFHEPTITDIQTQKFEIKGLVSALGDENNTTLSITENQDGALALSLELIPKNIHWGLHTAFPNLPESSGSEGIRLVRKNSCFYDISFINPVITISDYSDLNNGISKGFYLSSTINLGDPFNALNSRLANASPLKANGTIDVTNTTPKLKLEIELGELTFPLAGSIIENNLLVLENTLATDKNPAESKAVIKGQLELRAGSPPITIETSILDGDFIWDFRAFLPSGEFSLAVAFNELANLGGIPSAEFRLPDELAKLSSFSLVEIGVGVRPENSSIQYLSFAIASPEIWQTPVPDIAVSNLGASWTFLLDAPLTSHGYVYGDVVLGHGAAQFSVNLSARLPDFALHMELAEESEIKLRAFADTYFGAYPFEHDFSIDRFDLMAEPKDANYSALVEIKDDWPILDKLILSPLSLSLESNNGSVSGTLTARFSMDELQFYARATYPESNDGFEFSGGELSQEPILIGHFIQKVAKYFDVPGDLPKAIKDSSIEQLSASFHTGTKDFSFICEIRFPINDTEFDMTVNVSVKHQGSGNYVKTISGHLIVGSRTFDVVFSTDGTESLFIGAYHKLQGEQINLKDLISPLSQDTAKHIPDGMSLTLNNTLLAIEKEQKSKFLFGVEMGAGLNISNLPLVGRVFPPNETIKLKVNVLVASDTLSSTKEITSINTILPADVTRVPERDLPAGLTLDTPMQFGDKSEDINLPVKVSDDTPINPDQQLQSTEEKTDIKWFDLQRNFGPVHFDRIGVTYRNSELWVLLDASLAAAGLTLSLDGLGVSSPLNSFHPNFHLEGLGLDYKNGALEIGGRFLHSSVPATDLHPAYDEYSGKALIHTSKLSLSAIGSYANLDGHPSLFVYGVLDLPIGGPAFFFVTGLAAGFGYNRSLNIPALSKLTTFPLVSEAMGNLASAANEREELRRLHTFIPPSIGNHFLAVGIKFTSFKLIDSFALLTVAFGHNFEIDVLGLSTLAAPSPELGQTLTPLVEVQLALRARFIPSEGFLGVDARLTPASFLLSRDCHLTGGFAFYSWFHGDYAGDFVLTLGGYNRLFTVPENYPSVPRLGFNWKIGDHVTIKGEAYFALCGHALMAGGRLEAIWLDGSLKAWFIAVADFLIAWKPYHYDAELSVSMGVKYTFHFFGTHHISVDIGADLHLWGPEFSGRAHVKLAVVSFTVSFGKHAAEKIKPLKWNDPEVPSFKPSFLPSDEKICSSVIETGLVREVKQGNPGEEYSLFVVNPKDFSISTHSVIPIKLAWKGNNATKKSLPIDDATVDFGIGAMEVSAAELDTNHFIEIDKIDQHNTESAEHLFQFVPIVKSVPKAMWGHELKPDLNSQSLIENTLSGFSISPIAPEKPNKTLPVDRNKLQYSTDIALNAWRWDSIQGFNPALPPEIPDEETDSEYADRWGLYRRQQLQESLASPDVFSKRSRLLGALSIEPTVRFSDTITDSFRVAPHIENVVTIE